MLRYFFAQLVCRGLYEGLDEAYLVPEAMDKLRKANELQDFVANPNKSGEINHRELMNRQLLREIMTEAGWIVEPSEWWHFNAMPLSEASEKYTVIK